MCRNCDPSPNSAACECRWSSTWLQNAHCNASAASPVDIRSATADTRPCASRVCATTSRVDSLPRGNSLSAVVAGSNNTANYRRCIKRKEAKEALPNKYPERALKSAATGHPPAPGPLSSRRVESHSPRGRVKATTTRPPNPNFSPQPVTGAPKQPKVTTARKAARPKKPEPKSTAAPKPAAGKPKKAAAIVKTAAAEHTTPNVLVPTQRFTSPLEQISDILDRLFSKHVWR